MSVESLRVAIAERTRELLIPALMAAGVGQHKRGWKNCPCSWCETKREATVVIGSHAPHFIGVYTSGENLREEWRNQKRQEYRAKLAELEAT